jgi:hypothetical protein
MIGGNSNAHVSSFYWLANEFAMYRPFIAFALHSSHFRLRIVIQSPDGGSIRQYQGVIRTNSAGRNLSIAGA